MRGGFILDVVGNLKPFSPPNLLGRKGGGLITGRGIQVRLTGMGQVARGEPVRVDVSVQQKARKIPGSYRRGWVVATGGYELARRGGFRAGPTVTRGGAKAGINRKTSNGIPALGPQTKKGAMTEAWDPGAVGGGNGRLQEQGSLLRGKSRQTVDAILRHPWQGKWKKGKIDGKKNFHQRGGTARKIFPASNSNCFRAEEIEPKAVLATSNLNGKEVLSDVAARRWVDRALAGQGFHHRRGILGVLRLKTWGQAPKSGTKKRR